LTALQVDRVYGWKATPYAPIKESLAKQEKSVIMEFDKLVKETVSKFAEQSLNATLYYTNKDFKKWISLVPTSAVTGEGIPDLIMLLVQLTQKMMADKLLYLSTLQCTVLEVSYIFIMLTLNDDTCAVGESGRRIGYYN
jgi:translation initiation factor 5B